MKNNISSIHDCYGCGVCTAACHKKIIEIRLNSEGFYEPYVTNEDACTSCGLCKDVCAFNHDTLSLESSQPHSFAAWSKDFAVRRRCSSGGVAFEVGRYLLGQGYKVLGVRYNPDKEWAEHYVATTVEELVQSIGSKYIQSYTVSGLKTLKRGERFLVTGTPCQIDSVRRLIHRMKWNEDDFVLLDFFCHGVPSMLLWKKYLKMTEKTTGKVIYASWRNKQTGWHDSWAMGIDGEESSTEKIDWHDSYQMLIREKKSFIESRMSQGDAFYALFLSDCCLGKACYDHCKYKYDHSSADIRIGDLWGKTYAHDEDGVSAAVAFTAKGLSVLQGCGCQLTPHKFDVVAEGQMYQCPKRGKDYAKVMSQLRDAKQGIDEIVRQLRRRQWLRRQWERIAHPTDTMKKIVRRIF